MPYNIVWEKRGIITQYIGKITTEDLLNSHKVFYSDFRSDSSEYNISDFSKTEKILMTTDGANNIVAYDYGESQSIKKLKIAIIASDVEIINLSEYYIKMSLKMNSTWFFKILDTMSQARNWINERS